MRNKRIVLCLMAWLLAVLPLKVTAQQLDYSRKGSLSLTLVSADGKDPMAGAELSLYYVATAGVNTAGKLNYLYTEDFKNCGTALNDPELTQKLNTFLAANTVSAKTVVTDSQGKATFGNLELGLYLLRQTGAAEGFASCAPFLVTVPMETESGYAYDVNASPKTNVVRLTDITIKKVWNTGSTSGLPTSVTVQLLRGKDVVETATLNKENSWKITYQNLPESDSYSIKETNVPKGYTPTYSKSGYTFTVTNTPALAQTGQVVWPIPVFALAGMILLLAGVGILRKPGKDNA